MDEGPFLLFKVGGDELPVDHVQAEQLSQWLEESARTTGVASVATARALSLTILQAITSSEIVELSGDDLPALLGTDLRYVAEAGPSRLTDLFVAISAAYRGEQAPASAGD